MLPYSGGTTDSIRRVYKKKPLGQPSAPREKSEMLGVSVSIPGFLPVPRSMKVEGLPMYYVSHKAHKLPPDLEADNDGMVGMNSALGMQLGTKTVGFFDHTKTWNVKGRKLRGSWYRLYNGPWDRNNHDYMREDGKTGRWLYQNVVRNAGPLVGSDQWSDWPTSKRKKQGRSVPMKRTRPQRER